jgi:hypothetical protein
MHKVTKRIVLVALFINAAIVGILLSFTQRECEKLAIDCLTSECNLVPETCRYVLHPGLSGAFLLLAFLLPFYFVLRSFDKD